MASAPKIEITDAAPSAAINVTPKSTPSERIAWAEEEQLRFGLALVERGECTQSQLQAALWASNSTKDSIVDSLTQQGVIRHERLIELMQEMNSDQIATTIRFDVPVADKKFLEEQKVVIYGQSSHSLYLGCLGDQDLVERHFARQYPKHGIRFMPVKPELVERFLANLDLLPHTGEEREQFGSIEVVRYVPDAIADADVLDTIVNLAGVLGASDIHIEPKAKSYTVFVRKDRLRRIVHEGSLKQYAAVRAQVKNRGGMDTVDARKTQDGKFTKQIMGRMFDLRVGSAPTIHPGLEKFVIRLLDPDRASMPLSALGISRLDILREIIRFPTGAFLISGKTNSGKTTTLTAILREEDRLARSCYELGDPIENRLEFVTQIQVNRAEGVDLSFHKGIRQIMRMDGEVMVVGEIRDEETADAFAMAAETGMLVMGTTHAGSVGETPARLSRLGVKQDDMRSLLRGVLSQRLVRKLCTTCSGEEEGAACRVCRGSGYAGMTVISEIVMTPTEKDVDALYNRTLVYEPFAVDALRKLDMGIIDEREINRAFQSELKHLEQHAENFPGVRELAERVKDAMDRPRRRQATKPVDPFVSGMSPEATRLAAQYEEQLRSVSVDTGPGTGWANFIGA